MLNLLREIEMKFNEPKISSHQSKNRPTQSQLSREKYKYRELFVSDISEKTLTKEWQPSYRHLHSACKRAMKTCRRASVLSFHILWTRIFHFLDISADEESNQRTSKNDTLACHPILFALSGTLRSLPWSSLFSFYIEAENTSFLF